MPHAPRTHHALRTLRAARTLRALRTDGPRRHDPAAGGATGSMTNPGTNPGRTTGGGGVDGQAAAGPDLAAYRRLRTAMAPRIPPALAAHLDRVVALAGVLARAHGGDETRAVLAAQGHDVLRAIPPAGLLARARERGLPLLPAEEAEPVLLHGPLGALELAERYGVTDAAVLEAVRWHTTGHPDFDVTAWAVFIADKVEPEKAARWPALTRVADLARRSLTEAAALYLELHAERLARAGQTPHPLAVRTLAALAAQDAPAKPGA